MERFVLTVDKWNEGEDGACSKRETILEKLLDSINIYDLEDYLRSKDEPRQGN